MKRVRTMVRANCLPLPKGTDHESDFALLADIFPTGYHGAELADVSPGESVAVFGAGMHPNQTVWVHNPREPNKETYKPKNKYLS